MKNPITLIIGDKERDTESINFRRYNSEKLESMSLAEFLDFIKQEIKKR